MRPASRDEVHLDKVRSLVQLFAQNFASMASRGQGFNDMPAGGVTTYD